MSMQAEPRPFTGKHMLAVMIGFFAVVLTANMTMVYFARSSWTGLVVANSYVASQEFNENTRKMEAMAAVDVHPVVSFTGGTLRVTLLTRAGEAIPAHGVRITLGRPSDENEDRTVDLAEQAPGTYEAAQVLGNGQWTGTVSADLPGFGAWSRPVRLVIRN